MYRQYIDWDPRPATMQILDEAISIIDQYELDALEPSFIERLIRAEYMNYLDLDVWKETEEEEEAQKYALRQLYEQWDEIKQTL